MKRREAIIFDLDGTLADSEPLHERALREAVQAEGMTLTSQQFETLCVGFGDLPALANICSANGREAPDALLARLSSHKHRAFDALLRSEGVPAAEGAVELVQASARAGPMAICSGSRRATVEGVLGALGIADLPRAIVSLDDVERGKPDPEPYAKTAELLGVATTACVAVEDTPTGVASAKAAGMGVVAVEHSMPADRLTEADLVVPRLATLSVETLLSI